MATSRRQVRQAQTIYPFGVGGIYDLRGESFVAVDTRNWPKKARRIDLTRLADRLGVDYFKAAPSAPSGKGAPPGGWPRLPYARFPTWLFCDRCRRMHLWESALEEQGEAPTCRRCQPASKLVPMRFIQICSRSHMSDVDWWWWSHSTSSPAERSECDRKSQLRFITSKESTGLDSLRISCDNCGATRDLRGVDGEEIVKAVGLRCSGKQPWQPRREAIECDEIPKVVQRGASNAYFPAISSAIDIPPMRAESDAASDERFAAIKQHPRWGDYLKAPARTKGLFQQIITIDVGVTEDEVASAAESENDGGPTAGSSKLEFPPDLDHDEWRVFVVPEDERPTTKNFVTRDTSLDLITKVTATSSALSEKLDGIVLADRIREVRALTGFSRYIPGGYVIPTHVAAGRPNWFPAVETFGEGIFIALDPASLAEWESHREVRARVAAHDGSLENSFQREWLRERAGRPMLARYPLLHTLAHLLIRQLSFDSGYNAASLRERVYGRIPIDDPKKAPMAGLLIYTAAGDSEGTLGGLVRQGEPDFLVETITRALEAGAWCSSDPLCSENSGQGLGNLNRAACHACVLLPETSCETGNALLDRTLVIGQAPVPGYFDSVLDTALQASTMAADK